MDELTNLPAQPEPEAPDANEPVSVCDIRFRSGSKIYYFDPNGLTPKDGDHVIIETARGPEYGYCCGGVHKVKASELVAPLRKVVRLANEQDRYVNEQNRKLEKLAYRTCQEKIAQLRLDMQLVSCECAFDGSKLLFYFTADDRVDFRELVKLLASIFRTRIELRQIGVRDKAKMVGGLGICGRPFCCGQFLNDFAPVSIKMAKTQNLSLNPTKISGTCGRLMCCLKYEQEAYEELLKTSPKAESLVDTPDGRGTITDVNLMGQSVKVRLESDPDEIRSYRNEEIAVLRSGRAKKTDAPIPEDLAPISGGKKAPRVAEEYPRFARTETASSDAQLPRRSRKDGGKKPAEAPPAQEKPAARAERVPAKPHRETKPTAEQPKAHKQPKEPAAAEATPKKRPDNRRRHRGGHANKAAPAQQSAQQAQAAPAKAAEGSAEAAKKPKNHWHRHHRPKKNP